MKITVDPKWTFLDALAAAWSAYSGGQQFGVPNRIRVLEQWANVVGRERAVFELESTLNEYANLNEASEKLELSLYTIRKLRKSFSAMPTNAPVYLEPSNLYEFLRTLPSIKVSSELSLIVDVLPKFSALLGYSEGEMFLEPSIAGTPRLRPDAILASKDASNPHIIIEVKHLIHNRKSDWVNAQAQLLDYLNASNANIGIILSLQKLGIQHRDNFSTYDLQTLTQSESLEIQRILGRPSSLSSRQIEELPKRSVILTELLAKVENAITNNDKKNSLEQLASEAFDIHPFIKCKYKNLRTTSSEIDIVCENLGSSGRTFLDEYGRYFLVECKNWSKPVGAKEVRDFLGKLRKTKTTLGVFFSSLGITGEAKGTDALREIHSAYDKDGMCIIVIAESDLRSINELSEIMALIDEKLDALRFDL